MSTKYMLINRYPLTEVNESELLSLFSEKETPERSFYLSEEKDELLEFVATESVEALFGNENELVQPFFELKDILSGDIKRELLKYVESPLLSDTPVPLTKYVQLRHVEVLPRAYSAYLDWRDKTIFNVVRENEKTIDAFDAYHSLISGVPGVMFISSFSCDPAEYLSPFTDDNYKEIVQQAGDDYITGGNEGLYTKVYQKIGK